MSTITKRALAEALKKMMEKKLLSKITVTDLAEACGINRHTFYYHFRDIYDLVEWIYCSEVERAIMGDDPADSWEERFRRFFTYARENKKFIMSTYASVQKDYLLRFMYTYIVKIISNILDEMAEGITVAPEKRKFITDFYTYAFEGIIFSWVRDGMEQDPEELIKILGAIITRGMRKILFFVFWKPEFNKDTELFSQIEDSGKKLNTVLFLFMEKITQENIMCL